MSDLITDIPYIPGNTKWTTGEQIWKLMEGNGLLRFGHFRKENVSENFHL